MPYVEVTHILEILMILFLSYLPSDLQRSPTYNVKYNKYF